MVRRVVRHVVRRKRRVIQGSGFFSFLKKVGNFIRKQRILSKGLRFAREILPSKLGTVAKLSSKGASALGFGRSIADKGKGLKLAGSGLSVAGRCRRRY